MNDVMIIHERYCRKCHKNTNHRELKKDYFECTQCGLKSIEKFEIREEDIDKENISYYLYIQNGYIFFNDMVSANLTTRKEIKKLMDGDVLRIPMYRVKK